MNGGTIKPARPSFSALSKATVTGHDAPADLLLRIALAGHQRDASGTANTQQMAQALPPCPPETRPVCRPQAVVYARTWQRFPSIFAEWLRLLALRGERVPADVVPHLLHVGATHKVWQPTIYPVLGNRGRWLAEHNRAYRWANKHNAPKRVSGNVIAEAEKKALRGLSERTGDIATRVKLLHRHGWPWSEAFTDVALAYLAEYIRRQQYPQLYNWVQGSDLPESLALRIPLSKSKALFDFLIQHKSNPHARRWQVVTVTDTLHHRSRLYEAVTGERL